MVYLNVLSGRWRQRDHMMAYDYYNYYYRLFFLLVANKQQTAIIHDDYFRRSAFAQGTQAIAIRNKRTAMDLMTFGPQDNN